jgi:sterol desaturase/sphingolipid hydroxylase (fatty acid hydroxylase superfamily)
VNYVVLAIPVFILLILLELLVTRIQEKDYYRLSDSINDLSCGIIDQILMVFLKTALFAGYVFVYERYRLFSIPGSAAAWVACFLGVDFLYYWFHRSGHEVNAFWAAHVVHHQSEEYNLAVALRQGAFQPAFSWVFYLPLALLGFPPLMFLTVSSIDTLYQFWIHTRAIGRLGPLEWVLNTPSNHRVHHGRNPKYIDRNHGGILIVWDRLFGTYQKEEEEPAYGITTPLRSFNPVWAHLHYWVELGQTARRAPRLADKVRLFLKPPGWQPAELGGFVPAPEVDPGHVKYETAAQGGLALYVFVQFLIVLGGTTALLFRQDVLAPGPRAAAAAAIVVTLVALGGLLERKAWAFSLETVRGLLILLAAVVGGAAGALPVAIAAVSAAAAIVLLAWLSRYRDATGSSAALPEPRG